MVGLQIMVRGHAGEVFRDESEAYAALVRAWGSAKSARYGRLRKQLGYRLGLVRVGLGSVSRAVVTAAACDGYRLIPVNVRRDGTVMRRSYADAITS